MAKILKKKFFEVDVPLVDEKYESYSESLESLGGRTLKLDLARKLKGKSTDIIFKIFIEDGKAVAYPKKMTLLPFFIKHMLHKGISYVEDSFKAQSKDGEVIIKPFMITRNKVSRAVRKTLRNSAKNWILDYLKEKTGQETFEDILSGTFQKQLSLKLKKIYPLAICEVRIFEIKEGKNTPKAVGEIEIKSESQPNAEVQEIKETIEIKEESKEEKVEEKAPEEIKKEKPAKKSKKAKTE